MMTNHYCKKKSWKMFVCLFIYCTFMLAPHFGNFTRGSLALELHIQIYIICCKILIWDSPYNVSGVATFTIGFIPICLFIFGKASFSKVFTPRWVSLLEPPAAPDWSNLIEFTNTKKPPNQNLGSIRFTIPNTFTAHAFNTHHQSSINTPRGKYFREAGFFKNKETYWNETDWNSPSIVH